MTRAQRLTFLGVAALIAVAAVVIVIASGGDDNKTSSEPPKSAEPAKAVVTVVNGKPKGGVKVLKYKEGDRVDLTVRSDTADEIHIHGYDLMKDVEKGGSVHFSFRATITGGFEIELEGRKEQIAELRVEP